MINIKYRLIAPNQIDVQFVDEELNDYELVVKPRYLSICKADQRYYKGNRDKEILDKKLPMALIHESIGYVVYSTNPEFKKNDPVVLIPNIPLDKDSNIKENYQRTSKFRGSNMDGFMQENIFCNASNVIKIPNENPSYVFLELMSVVFNALDNLDGKRVNDIVIYGDGCLSYIACLILRHLYDHVNITVIGKHTGKLKYFTIADNTYLTNEVPNNLSYDCVFECVGGANQEIALNNIINQIEPQGKIFLLSVSELPININTRLVLEKGLTIIGCSRSGKSDFENAIKLIKKKPKVLHHLSVLISDLVEIDGINSINHAFLIDNTNEFKTVMKWNL